MTTTLFRCTGMGGPETRLDRFGGHDLVWWLIVGALGAAWYFFLYLPQTQRNQMLNGRLQVLESQLEAEAIELKRVKREVNDLQRNDPQAWERAARARLGWLKANEVLDVQAWRREQIAAGRPDPLPDSDPKPGPEHASYPAEQALTSLKWPNP